MLQDPMSGPRAGGYYGGSFGTPGQGGANIGGMQGAGQPQAQRARGRSVSNIGMQSQPNAASGIAQWQDNVQASQASSPTLVDENAYAGYPTRGHQQSQYVVADSPLDPGPPPNLDNTSLSKKEKKKILEHWSKQNESWQRYATSQADPRKRSKSQSRYNDGQAINFPKSQPGSDIERAMNKLSIGGLRPQQKDAAQRQNERGRRLSGGALGLSGSAAQQEEQQRMMRARSRSRQRFEEDETMGGIRPAYMPATRTNIANVDSGLINVGQPTVYPSATSSQYVNTSGGRQEPSRTPLMGQYVIGAAASAVNPYGQPQVSPMYSQQQLPAQAQQQGYISTTTLDGQPALAIPLGPINQYGALAAAIPGISPINPVMDATNSIQYMTPGYGNQPLLQQPQYQDQTAPPRRKTNIADVMNASKLQQQQQQYPGYVNPKTILTPAPPPRQLQTSNIANVNSIMNQQQHPQQHQQYQQQQQQQQQPTGQARQRALSQSGYGAPPALQAAPSNNRHSAYINTSGIEPGQSGMGSNANAYPMRPGFNHSDSLQTTGPEGFGTPPGHARKVSAQTDLRQGNHGTKTTTGSVTSSRSGVPVVSMRKPDPHIRVQHFEPKIVSYDLNAEHRQQVPLRFGKFVYDRDVQHDEWEAFKQQILGAWAQRDPRPDHYHSAVKRIDNILAAWCYAFFNPRGMDVVLFKGNERRSGARFGEVEERLEFHDWAEPPSDPEESDSDDDEDDSADEDDPANYLAQVNPQFRAQLQHDREVKRARRAEEKRREMASRPIEKPHSLVVYEIPLPGESYR